MLETNDDGTVPRPTFNDWLLQISQNMLTREEVDYIVHQVDKDDDGQISLEEFHSFLKVNSFFDA